MVLWYHVTELKSWNVCERVKDFKQLTIVILEPILGIVKYMTNDEIFWWYPNNMSSLL